MFIAQTRVLWRYLVVSVTGLMLVGSVGCDNLARSQGKFPLLNSYGQNALEPSSIPLDESLYIVPPPHLAHEKVEGLVGGKIPLVRIGYRSPWTGRTLNRRGNGEDWGRQSTYMVIDATNMVRVPDLGATTDVEYRQKLAKIAKMLVDAADWNGDVYWRHLTTFLETYEAVDSASKAALGSAVAATFISPVLGASLAGASLLVDTFIEEYTHGVNADEYAQLRDAASTYRGVLREKIFARVNEAKLSDESRNDILVLASDYAYTYSITGAIDAAVRQNAELKQVLITGESEWRGYFDNEIARYKVHRARESGSSESLSAELKRLMEFENTQEALNQESRAAIQNERRLAELYAAKREAEEERLRMLEAKQRADEAAAAGSSSSSSEAGER